MMRAIRVPRPPAAPRRDRKPDRFIRRIDYELRRAANTSSLEPASMKDNGSAEGTTWCEGTLV
jgi:hypothetical protein